MPAASSASAETNERVRIGALDHGQLRREVLVAFGEGLLGGDLDAVGLQRLLEDVVARLW